MATFYTLLVERDKSIVATSTENMWTPIPRVEVRRVPKGWDHRHASRVCYRTTYAQAVDEFNKRYFAGVLTGSVACSVPDPFAHMPGFNLTHYALFSVGDLPRMIVEPCSSLRDLAEMCEVNKIPWCVGVIATECAWFRLFNSLERRGLIT